MSTLVMSSKMLVSRRSFLKAAAAAPALSLPGLVQAQSQTTLRFVPVIDRRYPLAEIADAYRYVQTGEKAGVVVIDIG